MSRLPAALLLTVLLCAGCGSEPPPTVAAPRLGTTVERAPSPSPSPAPVVVERGDGDLQVVPGTGPVVGSGPLRTYVVEVEGGLGIDVEQLAAAVERTLGDPRSWTSGGRRSLQRVDGDADLRVALTSPDTTDRLCAPLDTVGRFSCANGDRAVLNAARWLTGAQAYGSDLPSYRHYLVNHEVGHVLGFGHADCPGAGEVAPVMVQQTISLEGCAPGPWPYP